MLRTERRLWSGKWFHTGVENQDSSLTILLMQNLPTVGSCVIRRRDYISCTGGRIVFYISLHCQSLKIIQFRCFSRKSWQLQTHIPTWWPWVGSGEGLPVFAGACVIPCSSVPTTPVYWRFSDAQCHQAYSILHLGHSIHFLCLDWWTLNSRDGLDPNPSELFDYLELFTPRGNVHSLPAMLKVPPVVVGLHAEW